MRNQFRGLPVLLLTLSVPISAAACNAQVLEFDAADAAAVHDGASVRASIPTCELAASATLDVDTGTTIAELTDTQACSLCAWLVGEFESVDSDQVGSPDQAPASNGYATGPSMGCGGSGATGGLVWTGIPVQSCVENLRSSPCEGTVGSLSQCIRYFASTHNPAIDPSGDCSRLAQNCDAFTSAASCGSTVLVAPTPSLSTCTGALPITPDAGTCACEGC